MYKALKFIKRNAVLCIAILAALITSYFVRPDKEYISYFDFKTLTCLFCVLAVVCALKNINFFYMIAQNIVVYFKNARMCVLALVYITFIGSMLIANDMALLTFLPLGYFVLTSCKKENLMAFVFIMQNIAANLGGMLTPFGNPQNLYLYSKFNIPTLEFMQIMAIPFILSIALITVTCICFVKKEELIIEKKEIKMPTLKTIIYLLLFIYSIVIVFRVIPYWTGLIIISAFLFFMDRKALKDVDYGLLFTFAAFFIFSGNMARIEGVEKIFTALLEKNTMIFSILCCQFISNVPTSILLSQFTNDYAHLLIGVNIGGAGTLVASLASLITLKEYTKSNPGKFWVYIKEFSVINFSFLIIIIAILTFLHI